MQRKSEQISVEKFLELLAVSAQPEAYGDRMENENTKFESFEKPLTIAKKRFMRHFEMEEQDFDRMIKDRSCFQEWIGDVALCAALEEKSFHDLFIKWLESFWMEYKDLARKYKGQRNG